MVEFIIKETHKVRLSVNVNLSQDSVQELQHAGLTGMKTDLTEMSEDTFFIFFLLGL